MVDEWTIAAIEQMFVRNPKCAMVAYQCLAKLQAGFFDVEWTAAVFQHWDRRPVTVYDAWIFAMVNAAYHCGDLQIALVDVGAEPAGDKATTINNDRLSDLPPPFWASFAGGNVPSDGYLKWDKPVVVESPECAILHETIKTRILQPGGASLEVGFTQSATTYHYFCSGSPIARWPYGSTRIWLLVPEKPLAFPERRVQPMEQASLFAA